MRRPADSAEALSRFIAETTVGWLAKWLGAARYDTVFVPDGTEQSS
ncbi:MAG: hypothetical protein IID06_06085 [Gemmatimonadetes bacterium]|nr:hypothetical protein [Gemmatimonadota bacterium]